MIAQDAIDPHVGLAQPKRAADRGRDEQIALDVTPAPGEELEPGQRPRPAGSGALPSSRSSTHSARAPAACELQAAEALDRAGRLAPAQDHGCMREGARERREQALRPALENAAVPSALHEEQEALGRFATA